MLKLANLVTQISSGMLGDLVRHAADSYVLREFGPLEPATVLLDSRNQGPHRLRQLSDGSEIDGHTYPGIETSCGYESRHLRAR